MGLVFWAGCVIYFLPKTTFGDPGFIPLPNMSSLKSTILEMVEKDTLDRRHFCPTCLIRKPLRSKHDKHTDRCVAVFDHYCPWVYNAIGIKNHRPFLIFLAGATICQAIYIPLAIICTLALFLSLTLSILSFFF